MDKMKISLILVITKTFIVLCLHKSSDAVCPQNCRCINKEVNCYGAGFTKIPPNLATDTVKLDLQSNEIEILDTTSFQGLPNLKEIKLRYNKLKTIENGTFDKVLSLERIDMGTNLLTSLPEGVFSFLKNLTLVDVSENFLTNIDGVFNNLPYLQRLDLGGNMIQQLTNTSFTGLKKLIYLILSKNTISNVAKKSLSSLKKLSFVLMSNNPLKNIDNVLKKNKRVSFLDLSKCQLERIPRGIPASIRYFQLSQNNIQNISTEDLAPYINMGILVLDKNNISYIEHSALTKMSFLREFWLNANQLEKIPNIPATVESLHMEMNKVAKIETNDFPAESKLKILSLKGNLIESIDTNGLKNLEKLTDLYLNDNKLEKVNSHVFANLVNLEKLELNKNKIKTIKQNALNGMFSLKTLEMTFIEEETVIEDENLFQYAPVLKILDLQGSSSIANFIFTSNGMVRSLRKIEDLNLMDCQLTTVSPILYGYQNLKHLKLAGNRWHCDQRMKWLRDWIKFDDGILMYSNHLVCYTPLYLQNRPIGSLRDAEFTVVTTSTELTTKGITFTNSTPVSSSLDKSSMSSHLTATTTFTNTTQQTVSSTLITASTQRAKIEFNEKSTTVKKSKHPEPPENELTLDTQPSTSKDNEPKTSNNKNKINEDHSTTEYKASVNTKHFTDLFTTTSVPNSATVSSTVSRNSNTLFTPSGRTVVGETSIMSQGESTTIINRSKKTRSTQTLTQENTSKHIIPEKPTPAVNDVTNVRRASRVAGRKYSSYTRTTTPIYNVTVFSRTLFTKLQNQDQISTELVSPSSTMLVDEGWLEKHVQNTTTTIILANYSTPKHINISYVDGIAVPDNVKPNVGQSSSRKFQIETENVKIIVLVSAMAIVAIVALVIMAAFLKKRYSRKQRYHTARVFCDKNARKISIIDIEDENPDGEQVLTSDKASMTSHSLDVTQVIADEPEQCLLDS